MDKRILSWCLYDFANSSYSAVIASVVFPVYYTTVIAGNETGLGDLWWGRAVSLSMAFVAVTSPFLGGIADYSGIRKRLLMAYTMTAVVAVSMLCFLQKGMYFEGFLIILIANIAMEGAFVFYNSYLPIIAKPDMLGRVSGWGFALGYSGSILSLLISLWLIKQGFISLVWPATAVFFAIFSIPAFLYLPKDHIKRDGLIASAIRGLKGVVDTFKMLTKRRDARRFLIAYFVYEDGVNTVIVFSSIFAATTLGFQSQELVVLYLIVQVSALVGAFVMSRPIDTIGPKRVLNLSLMLWIMVTTTAYFVYSKEIFFIIATIAGLGLGTVQASSRALFANFIPQGREAEYFGFYALVGKTSAILGPLMFGHLSITFQSQRPAVLSVSLLFIVGLFLLRSLSVQRQL